MTRYHTRFGANTVVDEVFEAWCSGDIGRMLQAMALHTNLVDRHCLLQKTVTLLYAQRSNPGNRATMLHVSRIHLAEMKELLSGLQLNDEMNLAQLNDHRRRLAQRRQIDESPDLVHVPTRRAVSTYLLLVRVLCEDGLYDDAKEVWREAVYVGYLLPGELDAELAAVDLRRKKAINRAEKNSNGAGQHARKPLPRTISPQAPNH